ncbi:MAG: hypothetical protein RLZZ385_795 [Pseudomonadota bacterium]|jgi:iron complex transport system substrate-binding protein
MGRQRMGQKGFHWIAPLLLAVLSTAAAAQPPPRSGDSPAIVVRDDDDHTVSLARPARRIISLAPSLTEMVYAAGAGQYLVGVVEYSDYPPAATALPVVGRHDLLDMEAIVALQPDLVLAWQSGNPRTAIDGLRRLGLTVYVAEPKSLQSIPDHIDQVAQLAGTEQQAGVLSTQLRSQLRQLQETFSRRPALRVFYQVWDNPLITAGGNELIDDIISLCGGTNVFADLNLLAPKVSVEAVLARDPQVVIASGMDVSRPEWLDRWLQWPGLTAVATGQLYFIPPDLLQRHTPRALQGAAMMCEQIEAARLYASTQDKSQGQ